jgi:predicted permease
VSSAVEAASPRLALVAVLHSGIRREQAEARLSGITASLRALDPTANAKLEVSLDDVSKLGTAVPGQNGEISGVAFFMMGMAAVVLLIACLNLANLLLARGRTRGREIAVRLAVGGSRTRILGQLLTESLMLSLVGAAIGVVLGMGGTMLLVNSLAPAMPFAFAVSPVPDLRTLAVALGLALMATAAFGLGPALRLARTDLAPQLKEVSGELPGGSRGMRLRHALVVGQLALSLVLLTAAGLFTLGAMASFSSNPGFRLEGGVVAAVDPALAGGGSQPASSLLSSAVERLRQLPGVESAALATSIPYGTDGTFGPVRPAGKASEDLTRWAKTVGVTADYFRTVRLPLLRGRVFTTGEAGMPTETARVAVVDEPLARALWPEGDAVGRLIEVQDGESENEPWQILEVVGVVAGVRDGIDSQPGQHLYLPFDASHNAAAFIHARAASDDSAATGAVREAIASDLRRSGIGLPVLSVKTLEEHRDGSLYHWMAAASAQVFMAFGIAALVLAVLGVYGVKSYLVACRRREIAIRVAVGASSLDILRLVVTDGAWLTLAGLGVGLALAAALCQMLGSWVYGVPGMNVGVLLFASAVLATSSLAAAYLPARRGVRVAPIAALGRG